MSDFLELSLTGVEGSQWDVSGPQAGAQGVWMLPQTSKLLSDTPAKTFWIKSGYGQKYQGFQYQRRDPLFGFFIDPDASPQQWRDIDSRFRLALGHYNDQFVISATTQPDNQTRQLTIRLLQEPTSWEKGAWEGKDPHLYSASTIVVDGACETPHWVGEMETASWTITSGSSGAANILLPGNPGDVAIFPRWFVNAPTSGTATWTIPDYSWGQEADFFRPAGADATRTVPLPGLLPGEDCDVNTNDDLEYIIAVNKSPVWMRNNGDFAFYPIAPQTPPTLVPISVTGATPPMTATVECDRWYTRAWGVSR